MNWIALLACVFGIAVPASAQFTRSMTAGPGGSTTIEFTAIAHSRAVSPVTGLPYSAEQTTETIQTLADGTHIRRNRSSEMIYRDSQGRTRTERSIGAAGAKYVEIVDPAAGYQYVLDEANHIAHRVAFEFRNPEMGKAALHANGAVSTPLAGRARPLGTPPVPRVEMQDEDLGTQVIEGVRARGMKLTRTWPVDSIGNDRPMAATNETWSSDQLGGVMVLARMNDPRFGETTTALKNINLAEPEPSLFMPPAGYQIVEETGRFSVTLSRVAATAAQ